MRVLHLSDTHSHFPDLNLDGVDLIVHSGDLAPNFCPRDVSKERRLQQDWWGKNVDRFRRWIGDKEFLFCQGNHDFASPTGLFLSYGLLAKDITHRPVIRKGMWFYGFPDVPFMDYGWNWESPPVDMARSLDQLSNFASDGKDYVLVAHCPPYSFLDTNLYGQHIGNAMLANRLATGFLKPPKAILCGHVHEEGGKQATMAFPEEDGSLRICPIYNSALTVRQVEI